LLLTQPENASLTKRILENIASSLSFASVRALIEYNLEYLIGKWIETKHPLSSFPIQLCEVTDISEFMIRYERAVVPKLVFMRERATLLQIAQILNKDLMELAKDNFSRIFAFTYPLYYTDQDKLAGEICESFLGEFYTQDCE
jgi:hypothetical protein